MALSCGYGDITDIEALERAERLIAEKEKADREARQQELEARRVALRAQRKSAEGQGTPEEPCDLSNAINEADDRVTLEAASRCATEQEADGATEERQGVVKEQRNGKGKQAPEEQNESEKMKPTKKNVEEKEARDMLRTDTMNEAAALVAWGSGVDTTEATSVSSGKLDVRLAP